MVPPLKHILCIDDEEDILQVTRLALETLGGFKVSVCRGSSTALAQVKSLKPDLILLDVMMPGMDGPSTLKMIHADPEVADIPVVFMTAKVQPAEVDHYLTIGASGVIGKPFDPMALPKQVETLWRGFHEP
jgi:two-component system OmpR family response regulator